MPTTTDLSISAAVTSTAIAHLEIVAVDDDCYDLLVTFNSGSKVYRYAWEDEGECQRWHDLLSDDEAKAATSWGREFHRALKHRDIEEIDI
jgi:hypothetical protein